MLEITHGSIEEQILQILKKRYPVTIADIEAYLHLSHQKIVRTLLKMQTHHILRLEPLPDKTFIRLLSPHYYSIQKKPKRKQTSDENNNMYV